MPKQQSRLRVEDVTGLLSLLQPPKHGGRGGRDMHPRTWDPADGVEGMVKLPVCWLR